MKKLLIALAFITVSMSFGQSDQFTDKTLQKFAEAYTEVRNENMNLQLNMITKIEDAGLSSDEFTNIHIQLQDPETAGKVTEANKRKYHVAVKNIEELNRSIQESIERIIANNGLKVETYHAIAKASQSDATLKNKIQEYLK